LGVLRAVDDRGPTFEAGSGSLRTRATTTARPLFAAFASMTFAAPPTSVVLLSGTAGGEELVVDAPGRTTASAHAAGDRQRIALRRRPRISGDRRLRQRRQANESSSARPPGSRWKPSAAPVGSVDVLDVPSKIDPT
jgi:hypothetical protein